jgi:hypothetical protein
MKGSNAVSLDHAVANRVRKSKSSGVAANHRHPLSPGARARTSAPTASAIANTETIASSPAYASASTTSVTPRHH